MAQLVSLESFLNRVQQRDPHQPEFSQAVREVFSTLWPFLEQNPRYAEQSLLERLVEPERVIQFLVAWTDDKGQVQVNRAWRVQFSSAIGPYYSAENHLIPKGKIFDTFKKYTKARYLIPTDD